MAITTGAADGVRITSAAKNGSLGDQTGVGSDEIRFPSAMSTNNGQVGSVDFDKRMVILRRGLSDEDERYITAIVSGNLCRVNEVWTSAPTSGNTYDISYVANDADDSGITGFGLVNKRVTDYTLSRLFSVGNDGGGTFGYFSLTDGYSLESDDTIAANDHGFNVEASARFSVGYNNAGNPVSGGYLISTANAAGEGSIVVEPGGELYGYDFFLTCVQNNTTTFTGKTIISKGKVYAGTYDVDLTGDTTLTDMTFEGRASTADSLTVSGSTTINIMNAISIFGINNNSAVVDDVITMKNVAYVNPVDNHYLDVNSSGIFNLVNPSWNIGTDGASTTSSAIVFNDSTGEVHEKWSLNYNVTDTTGSALASATTWLYVSSYLGAVATTPIEYKDITDTGGSAGVEFETREFTPKTTAIASIRTQSGFSSKIFYYGKTPYIGNITGSAATDLAVGMPNDGAITASVAASAIDNGTGIDLIQHATALTVLAYASGDTAFTTDAVVSGQTTGAEGTVREYLGDSTSGVVVLHSRNGTSFAGNEDLFVSGSRYAEASSTEFNEDYTWEVNCTSLAMTVTYDYLSAKMAENSPDTVFKDAITWGRRQQTQQLQLGPDGYYTVAVASAGVWLSRRGSGTIDYMTADSGNTYVPPIQYTFTLTGLKSGSEIRMYNSTTDTEITGTESSSTTFSYNYIYGGDIGIYVIIFHLSYKEIRLTGQTLSNSNQSIPVQQQTDRVYKNP